jgi:flagellar transcriptional activator FlhD
MHPNETVSAIQELNLSYLMLAQRLVRESEPEATFRLGVSTEVASLLGALSPAQLLKLASTNVLLCRFRFDDHAILSALTSRSSQHDLQPMQLAILMAAQPVESIN